MSRKKRLIIPIFIPFGGCPNQCVFCDQEGITGNDAMPSLEEVRTTIESYLATWKGKGEKEAAFYGGSFTGLPKDVQIRYLKEAYGFVAASRIDSIRLSTRPDYINPDIAAYLKEYGVKTVELGVQSMSDEVLRKSGRGHSREDTMKAVKTLKEHGFTIGLQFMPGLPGDDEAAIIDTADEIIALAPDFVRIYPTLILKGTPLHKMYQRGEYAPWPLEKMAAVCGKLSALFSGASIPIIRMGLQPTAELEKSLIAGPYHPSFRQLVEGLST